MEKKSIKKKKFAYTLFFTLFLLMLIATSCTSRRDIIYFQDIENFAPGAVDRTRSQVRIIPNNNLLIRVSALNPVAAEPFNVVGSSSGNASISATSWNGYLVTEKGEINFPVIGKVSLGGLTKAEAESLLENKISQYISNPVVNIRIMNYQVSVLGEVNRPGTYTINDERVSLPQLLSLAGDLTILGERRNIQIFRMENGEKKFYTVDLTSPEIFYSPNYYLQQNDLVYVKPNGTRVRAAGMNQNLSLLITSVTFLIAIYSFVIRNK